jgi:hypothetical protein
VPGGQKMLVWIGDFSYHPGIFGVLNTKSRRFGVSHTASGFQIPVKTIRGFTYQTSGYRILGFEVSDTKLRGFRYRGLKNSEHGEGLREGFPGHNTLNTDSNLINTKQPRDACPVALIFNALLSVPGIE